MALSPNELAHLRYARYLLENVGLAVRIANAVGTSIEKLFGILPQGAADLISVATNKALTNRAIGGTAHIRLGDRDSRRTSDEAPRTHFERGLQDRKEASPSPPVHSCGLAMLAITGFRGRRS